ncbi:holo-ACP synthase [Neptuniibacter sp.]|uniref:holo-ACP synthase n=1 Tax=Neptuniibacter sp. TaxID=1962643 RepID=UPI00262CAEE9|nr:holo-ACP synthase [Neptuniibacter sp.]MCP4598888.1 holo-ACP synthase [Neptuniibacter sp.]
MILGIGTDIIQISRVADSLIRTPKLPDRILTPEELEHYSQVRNQATYLAKRFAAKEAIVKALGTGIGRGVSWQHIQISKDELGKPLIELSDGAQLRANELGITNFQLSYSDEKEYVVAFAIAEG